jgi:elongation factor Ts
MPNIEQIKQLREETGVSMMECKKALEKTDGDIEKAKKVLRERGVELAGKRAGKATGEGLITSYIHSNNKVGVLLDIRCESDFVAKSEDFKTLAHEICLQIAAAKPKYIKDEDVTEKELKEEKEIVLKQCEGSNKPENIVEQIVEGRIKKFKKEIVLLMQPWVKDDKQTIGDLVNDKVAKIGEKIIINRFERFEI